MLTSLEATKIAREAIAVLIDRSIEGIESCERKDEGFVVAVEVLESKGQIADYDILAVYELVIDQKSGDVVRYNRLARRKRSVATAA